MLPSIRSKDIEKYDDDKPVRRDFKLSMAFRYCGGCLHSPMYVSNRIFNRRISFIELFGTHIPYHSTMAVHAIPYVYLRLTSLPEPQTLSPPILILNPLALHPKSQAPIPSQKHHRAHCPKARKLPPPERPKNPFLGQLVRLHPSPGELITP